MIEPDPEVRGIDWAIMGCFIGALLLVAWLLLLMAKPANAHDHDHPELTDWYKSLRSGKGPCCDGSDAQSVDDPDWENNSGHYRVKIEGEWTDVDDDAVITEPNRAGIAKVWPMHKDGHPKARCFMPGSGA